MSNVDDRGAPLLYQVNHEVENLCSDGNIEHRDGLVCYDKLRVKNESSSHGHSLTLATAELVWKTEKERLRRNKLDIAEGCLHPRLNLRLVLSNLLHTNWLGDDLLDRHRRVKGLEWILEDNLDPPPEVLGAPQAVQILLEFFEMQITQIPLRGERIELALLDVTRIHGMLGLPTASNDDADGSLLDFPYVLQPLSELDRKSTRLNSSHSQISYAVFCLQKKILRRRARRVPPDGRDPRGGRLVPVVAQYPRRRVHL